MKISVPVTRLRWIKGIFKCSTFIISINVNVHHHIRTDTVIAFSEHLFIKKGISNFPPNYVISGTGFEIKICKMFHAFYIEEKKLLNIANE